MSPHLSFDLVSDVHQLVAYQFMVNALQAAGIAAVAAAVVGWFMVLRAETFAGHTLSLMSFPGAAAAALAGVPLAWGYFAFCGAGALLIAGSARGGRPRSLAQQAAVVGMVGAGSLAVGYLLLSLYGGVLESLETLLFGSILGVTRAEVWTLASVGACAVAFLVIVGRPLFFASIDGALASAGRVPVGALSAAYLFVLGLAVAATAQITGVLLVFALLLAPAAIARELTPRIGLGLGLSVLLGLVVAWVGLSLSYFTNDPPGFFVTTIALALFAAARLASRLPAGRRPRGGHGGRPGAGRGGVPAAPSPAEGG